MLGPRKGMVLFYLYTRLRGEWMPGSRAPHSSTLAWKIPWTEEPGRLQPMGSLGVRHDWETSLSCIGEGNGNPLQCSCLENPRDGGAWWGAVHGVAESWTRLKWLSSSRDKCKWTSQYISQASNFKNTQCVNIQSVLLKSKYTINWDKVVCYQLGSSQQHPLPQHCTKHPPAEIQIVSQQFRN